MTRRVRQWPVSVIAVVALVVALGQAAPVPAIAYPDVDGSASATSTESSPTLATTSSTSTSTTPTSEDDSATLEETEALALAVSSGEPISVGESVTPTSQLFALPTGEMRYEISTVPVRTEDGNGGWIPIDTDLVLRDGWWEPTASATPVRFSPGGSDVLDQVRTPDGEWLTETWPHGELPQPIIEGRNATYPEVLPDVDLRLTATDLGMASVYVVKTPEAAANEELTELQVDLEGADVTRERSGVFTAETPTGETVTGTSPLWWDSSDGGTAEGPGDAAPAMPVEHELTDNNITLDVVSTIDGVEPDYPIFIDPDWSTGPNAAWYTDVAFPNQSYLSAGASDVLRMGRYAQYRGNAFFEFNIAALSGKQIFSAQLSTTQTQVAAWPNSPVQLRLFGHQDAGFTWNQQNHGLWGPLMGTQSPGTWGGPAVTVGWGVTAGVQARVGQTWLQFGLAPEDENAQSRRHFSRSATLTVNYNTPPNTPTDLRFVTPNRSCGTEAAPGIISATQVTVGFNQTDPDPGNVDTNVDLHKTSDLVNRVQWKNPGLGAQGAKTVTFTDLVDGQAYAWRARGSDWSIDGASYSPWCYFTIDRTGPGIPSVSPPGSTPVVGKPTSVTFSTLPADRVAFIAYTVVQTSAVESFSFDLFNGPPACGSTIGQVRVACTNSSGSVAVTVAATDAQSTLLAIPSDVAGNPGVIPGTPAGEPGTVGARYSMNAVNDPLVTFSSGHVWLTQAQSNPLGASIPDTNATSPVPLTLGKDTLRTLTANPLSPGSTLRPVLGFRDPSTLTLGPGSTFGLSTVSTGGSSASLWTCNSGTNVVTGSAATCANLAPSATAQLAGYTWVTKAATGSAASAPLWICDFTGTGTSKLVKAVTNAQCTASGQPQAGVPVEQLGYVLTAIPTGPDYTRTAQAVRNPITSFTLSAWLKPAAGGSSAALSTSTSAAGIELGSTDTSWRFCLRPAAPATPVCASEARLPTAGWTHVTGVWDSTNKQIRLFINSTHVETVAFAWPAGTSAAAIVLNVGASAVGTTVASRWTGQIADPAIFGGVATDDQINLLRSGQDPVNG